LTLLGKSAGVDFCGEAVIFSSEGADEMWATSSFPFAPLCSWAFLLWGRRRSAQEQGGAGKGGSMRKKYFYVLGSTLRKWGIDPARVVKIGKNVYLCEKVPPALLDRRQRKEGGLFILRPLG